MIPIAEALGRRLASTPLLPQHAKTAPAGDPAQLTHFGLHPNAHMPKSPLQLVPKAGDENSDDISLFGGGLFYRAQLVTHLLEFGRWNLARRVTISLALCWLPLVILTAIFYRHELPALMKDYLLYARIVVGIPVLLIGQILMEGRFKVIVTHVRKAELLGPEDLSALENAILTLKRLRDSPVPELVIMALVCAQVVLIWKAKMPAGPSWAVTRSNGAAQVSLTGWYYGLVSIPIYQFLLGLNSWKWLLWSFLLFRLSRMRLRLLATHPDKHGGLGFLGLLPIGFIPIAFALSAVIGGSWRQSILDSRATLSSYVVPAIILVALNFAIALIPLSFFTTKLSLVRQRGMLEYGVLAQTRAADFQEKWIANRRGRDFAAMPSEVGSLADLSITYENIRQMRYFPADKNSLISLAVAVLLPLFPVVLAEIPFSDIVKGVMQAVKAVPM